MLNSFLVTILVPCFNEENMINIFFTRLSEVLKKYNHEIIFIDDGSTDHTLTQLKLLSAANDNVFYLSLSRNFGHQIALKAGYDHAKKGDCIICLDADLQHPPEIIHQLIEKWKLGFQIVNAVRDKSERLSYFKKVSSRMFYKIINYFSKYKINENGPDFRLIDKKVVEVIRSLKEENIFLREIISWAGFRQVNVFFNQQSRILGNSKYSPRKMFSLCLNAFFAYGINPLRIAVFIGVIFGRPVPLSFSVHDIRPDRWVSQHFKYFVPPQVAENRPEIETFYGWDRRFRI